MAVLPGSSAWTVTRRGYRSGQEAANAGCRETSSASARAARSPRRAPSTISASGTLRTGSPCRKSSPTPLPAATPTSASRASPGPFTTQPMTATFTGDVMSRKTPLDLGGDRHEVDLAAPAGGARDQLRPATADVERREDLPRHADLLLGIGRERDAQRVADAVREQRAEAHGRLHGARERGARLGHADVERIRDARRRAGGTRRWSRSPRTPSPRPRCR